VKVIAITTQSRDQAEFVLGALHDAVDQGRIKLDDLAVALKDASGGTELHKHHSWLHRKTVSKELLEQSETLLGPGEAAVLALGADDTIDAVGDRVRALSEGDMKTFEIGPDGISEVTGTTGSPAPADQEGLLRGLADPIPMPQGLMVKAPFS
jgi:hypothetical protein